MLGRYQLRARLGAGGMGTVYRAWDPVHEREVALKLLLSSETASSKRKLVETLFEREYHELARLKHPNIVGVYDYGVDASGPYYTMELLAGHDLRELSPLPYAALCLHLRDLASALALLHAHGFVHRDVSSRNVRLDPSGRVKLIDFGALAPFGIGTNIVGTASCMAPETLHRMPLDQRADLFALGVLGYAALTGVQPFPARELSQLPLLWARPPAPPSALVRDVPPALDALILSMISVDRLARPSSAAAVIERLNAIGQLPAEPHDLAAENYLLSGAMVGRERERESWQRHVADARDGRGAAVLISGAHGLGKTRLLHELCLDAELKGMLVLKADAQAATAEPFGAAFRLGAELLTTYPEPARRAAEPFAGLLTPIFPELTSAGAPGVAPALMPSERSARIQRALHEWFVRVSTERPVCLAVDNAHALDPSSASLLATLARAAPRLRMLILATERSEDARSAEESLHVCRSQATLLKLLPLSLVHCEQLVGSQFGDVPNAKRLARTLYDRSGGHPQHCIELAQSLVSKRIATYHAGTWILPAEVQSHELPSRVGELIDRRLAAVSGTARELAEVLSVDGSPVSLERCVALMSRHTRREVFDALSDLVAEQIFVSEHEQFRFAQDALREAVLAQLAEPRRRALHWQLAQEMLAEQPRHGRRVAAALHLVLAGEEARGADIIAEAGRAYLRDASAYDSTKVVVRALEQALAIYDRLGRPQAELLGVLHPLVTLGYYVDFRLVRDHGERGLAIGLEVTGLARAMQLSRFVGNKLALAIALGTAALKFRRVQREGFRYGLRDALMGTGVLVPGLVGFGAVTADLEMLERVRELLAPLRLLGNPVLYGFVEINRWLVAGHVHKVDETAAELARQCRSPELVARIGEGQSRAMCGGVLYVRAVVRCFMFGRGALDLIEEMESLGSQTFVAIAAQVRVFYHAARGELESAARSREAADLFALQGESTWQTDMYLPALLLDAHFLAGDMVAVRQSAEQLARRAQAMPSFSRYAQYAQAAYHSLRGDLAAALERFETLLERFPAYRGLHWLALRGHYADALNRVGQHQRAKQLLQHALGQAHAEDEIAVLLHLEPQRQLALAEAGLGEHADACRRLDALLAKHGHEDNHLLVGLLHKARVEVSLQMRDEPAARRHLEQLAQHFRATGNPALIAQLERLARSFQAQPPLEPWAQVSAATGASTAVLRSFAGLSTAAERQQRALQLVLAHTRAEQGFLYVLQGDVFRLVAANGNDQPPRHLEDSLRDAGLRSRSEDEADTRVLGQDSNVDASYRVLVLTSRAAQRRLVVGGLILQGNAHAAPDPEFLESIACALHEADSTLATG